MTSTDLRPRLLIVSASRSARDPRLAKQILALAPTYRISTCGFGMEIPEGAEEHLGFEPVYKPGTRVQQALTLTHLFSLLTVLNRDGRQARKALRSRIHDFDAILVDDIGLLPAVFECHPRVGVHVDLYEYWPRLRDSSVGWMKTIGAWNSWVCRTYLPRAASITTVNRALANQYRHDFGVEVGVVRNMTPYRDLTPTSVHEPIALVHSGTSSPARNHTALVQAVLATQGFTLDMYLTKGHPSHIAELRAMSSSDPRITIHDPVPYTELLDTLNGYDLGIFVLAPVNFNYANALPNKVFDFVQARLGQVVGPTPDMAKLVRDFDMGIVTTGFDASAIADALDSITPQQVTLWKGAADAAAAQLDGLEESRRWVPYIDDISAGERK